MPSHTSVYLALGSNLGDRLWNLQRALELLTEAGIEITKQSSAYETAPQQVADQPWFFNMVAEATTSWLPMGLLGVLQSVERQLGRNRQNELRFGPRSIDLDLLLYGSEIIDSEELVVPHPRMLERRFVLAPLIEIAPDLRDPRTGYALKDFLPGVLDQPIRLA